MMKLIQLLGVAVCLASFNGCASVSPQEVAAADFGKLPTDYKEMVKRDLLGQLKDPYSAVMTFGEPRKGYAAKGLVNGGGNRFGYYIPVAVNAKNSYGGYTGDQMYYYFFTEGILYMTYGPPEYL